MAKKGEIGTTAGKKSAIYTATMPDGVVLTKRSFVVHAEIAFMGAFKHNGQWVASGVVSSPQDWGDQQFFPAEKIK